jgi:8-oxo-dGTP pyrophosphatase MutT (NUDIX family)
LFICFNGIVGIMVGYVCRIVGPVTMPGNVSAIAVSFHTGKPTVLMLRLGGYAGTNEGKWTFPGGKVDPGDGDRSHAFTREWFEETMDVAGRDYSHDYVLGRFQGNTVHSIRVSNRHYNLTYYVGKLKLPFDVTLSAEHSAYCWVPLEWLLQRIQPSIRVNIFRRDGRCDRQTLIYKSVVRYTRKTLRDRNVRSIVGGMLGRRRASFNMSLFVF